ncbi:MAG: sugar ABC transporter ATP-binding protein [Phycisphaerales bacterium]|nr:sugar ABC transporter ATP-binding protein [Phycisphaerales bacterium]
MTATDTVLIAERISKRFGQTQALSDVSVSFRAGEVHALMGENGAGKSTLGKVIAGLHKQDTGTVSLLGQTLEAGSLDGAFHAGIRIVHQELAQCPNLSVAENLCLHDMPTRNGMVDFAEMIRRAEELVHQLDPTIDVRRPLGLLSPGRRQICQIAASLDRSEDGSTNAKVIVFDEPTSSLSISEANTLMGITRQLAADGLTIIYVSHRMSEIFGCCDRVSVLRDGKFVATNVVAEIDEPTLVEQMIGRRLSTPGAKGSLKAAISEIADDDNHAPPAGEPRMVVRDLNSPGKLQDISFELHPGEVLGVGGLVGAGRSELFDALFGIDTRATGSIVVDGNDIAGKGTRAAIKAGVGVGYVPEDRRIQGLFFNLGIDENILAPIMPEIAGMGGVRNAAEELEIVQRRIEKFQIKTASLRATTPDELSGGNQQKLLIARWMTQNTRVLLLDEPTRGIDVGTKAEVYKLIREAAEAGLAILLVSSEMPELLALSDRILVMGDGRIQGELTGTDMTQTNILTLATKENTPIGV